MRSNETFVIIVGIIALASFGNCDMKRKHETAMADKGFCKEVLAETGAPATSIYRWVPCPTPRVQVP